MWPCVQAGKQAQFAQSMRRGQPSGGLAVRESPGPSARGQEEDGPLWRSPSGQPAACAWPWPGAPLRWYLGMAAWWSWLLPTPGAPTLLLRPASIHLCLRKVQTNRNPGGGGAGRLRALGPQPSPKPPTTTTTTGVGRVYPHPGPTVPPCGLLSQWAWWRSCVCMCARTGPAPSPAPPSPFPTQQGSPQAGPRCLSW